MMEINTQTAAIRPWDPGLQDNDKSIWKETLYKAWVQSKVITRFMIKINNLRSQELRSQDRTYRIEIRTEANRLEQKLCSMIYEYELKINFLGTADCYKLLNDLSSTVLRSHHQVLETAREELKLLDIKLLKQKFPMVNYIQWEAEPTAMNQQRVQSVEVLSLSYANQVSCIDYNTCHELLSNKYCEVKVVKLNAATYGTVSHNYELLEELQMLPPEKDKTVKIFTLHFGKMGMLQD